mgnify:CR=1 FL=1
MFCMQERGVKVENGPEKASKRRRLSGTVTDGATDAAENKVIFTEIKTPVLTGNATNENLNGMLGGDKYITLLASLRCRSKNPMCYRIKRSAHMDELFCTVASALGKSPKEIRFTFESGTEVPPDNTPLQLAMEDGELILFHV